MGMKVTLIFRVGFASPTESYYSRLYVDPTTDAAQAAAMRLAAYRAGLLGDGAALVKVRMSRSDLRRVVVHPDLAGIQTSNGAGLGTFNESDSDQPNANVLVRASDLNGHAKSLFMSGMPVGCVKVSDSQPQYFEWASWFLSNWTIFRNELLANWNFRVQQPHPATAVKALENVTFPFKCAAVDVAGPLAGEPAAGTPFEVLLSGFRRNSTRFPSLSGVYECVDINTSSTHPGLKTYALGETGNVDIGNFLRLGTIAVQDYTEVPYKQVLVAGVGTHKRGGSAVAPRGRSRTRR